MAKLDHDDLRMMADAAARLVAAPAGAGWATYAELGWLALPIDEAHGGLGGDLVDMAAILRAAGAALLPDPLISTLFLGAGLIAAIGDDAQKARLLPAVGEGSLKLALLHFERKGGQDRNWVRATARAADGGWRIDGCKVRGLDAPGADRLLVSARIDADEVGLFLVDADQVTLDAYEAIDGRPMADVALTGCVAERIGGGDALAALGAALDRACLATCIDACGAMLAANAATLDYLKTRRQFGTTIGSFQALQHRMVDMVIAATRALALAIAASTAFERGDADAAGRVSAAKIATDQAAQLVGEQAIQLHGGIGVTEEYSVGRLLKRLLLARTMYGDSDWHLARLAG